MGLHGPVSQRLEDADSKPVCRGFESHPGYVMMCLWCRQSTSAKRYKYCSNACQQKYQTQQKIDAWLNGADGGDKNGELGKMFKAYLVEEAGGKCECGWGEINPYSGKVTLTIDHIDGDATNNKRENLKVLCYNCHTLTSTFNQLNRGKGTRRIKPGTRRNAPLTQR